MAGAGGFEPPHADTKNRCLTAWLRPNNLNLIKKLKLILKFIMQLLIVDCLSEKLLLFSYSSFTRSTNDSVVLFNHRSFNLCSRF